jgi:succinoglycan biosynthesis protein ExoA
VTVLGRERAPGVSVVIPCRNEKSHIERCVRAILSQQAPDGGFEVIVADGMSDDGTRDVLVRLAAQHPGLRLLDNPGKIASTGLNAAIDAARGRVIIRVDVHTTYAPDYVRECVAVLKESGADNVGGPWHATADGYVGRAIAAAFHSPFGSGGARAHDREYEGRVDTVYLGCWHRSIFERLGGFDEELVRNQADEFNLRITRAGGAIWQSLRIRSVYHPRESLWRLFHQYMQYGYWKVRVIQKHRVPASWRHLVPPGFILTLTALACLASFSPIARVGAAIVIAGYLLCTLAASVITAVSTEWQLLPVLPIVFACFHLGYGYGFLRGVWDFVIWRRGPTSRMSAITRTRRSES